MLVISLPLSIVLGLVWVFLSIRTVGNGAIQSLGVNDMQPDVFYAMVCINLSITEKNCGTVKQITS